MMARLARPLAVALALILLMVTMAFPQMAAPDDNSPQELDQMLAPIALYPDPLVSQILMAATYPLEVVQADRWLHDPAHASLSGDQLTEALVPLAWDPSVKSLAPFPQILRMMDDNLEWTERVGNGFLANQAAVMDSIQRLRARAEAAGKLSSTPQAMVSAEDGAITIEPTNPGMVYVPVYDPDLVYGPWPYPDYPPYYFPEYFGGVVIGGFGYGWMGFAIVAPLWGWSHWDWHHHRIDIDRGRVGRIDHHREPPGNIWAHDPGHRHGVPYPSPSVGRRFGGSTMPPEVQRGFRGYPTAPTTPAGSVIRPVPVAPAASGFQERPAPPAPARQAPVVQPLPVRPPSPRYPPTFESFGHGADVRGQADRGQASRMSAPAFQPSAPAPRGFAPHTAPSGGDRRR
ncbi:MAG: DUF3300 domain-containing protein [Cupriavidus sp.]|nr:DUF3300 domain-containing protein [Cupriavidus sp.]